MDVQKFSALITKLRKDRGLTQKQVAQYFGVSDKSVSKWERGETMPDVTLFPEIAEFYSISIDDLMRGEQVDEEKSDIQKCSRTFRSNFAKKYGLLFAAADIFLVIAFSAWLTVGFFTDNGWKDIFFSIALLIFTVGIMIGHISLVKKSKEAWGSNKRYSYFLSWLPPIVLTAVLCSIAGSKLTEYYGENISVGIIPTVAALFLCYGLAVAVAVPFVVYRLYKKTHKAQ